MLDDEVTLWIGRLAEGDTAAAQRLWERYYEQLVNLARKRLSAARRREFDEEDVALSAFGSFCDGAARGRFPRLADRDDLWKLLVTITARKAIAQIRKQRRLKHGGGKVRGESVFDVRTDDSHDIGIAQVLGQVPRPEIAVMSAEACGRLMRALDDDSYRQIAQWKLEGYTNEEIANKLDLSLRTIKRRLSRIRELWKAEGESWRLA